MKKDNIPGLEGYYISRLGILWSRYHKSGKLTQNERASKFIRSIKSNG